MAHRLYRMSQVCTKGHVNHVTSKSQARSPRKILQLPSISRNPSSNRVGDLQQLVVLGVAEAIVLKAVGTAGQGNSALAGLADQNVGEVHAGRGNARDGEGYCMSVHLARRMMMGCQLTARAGGSEGDGGTAEALVAAVELELGDTRGSVLAGPQLRTAADVDGVTAAGGVDDEVEETTAELGEDVEDGVAAGAELGLGLVAAHEGSGGNGNDAGGLHGDRLSGKVDGMSAGEEKAGVA